MKREFLADEDDGQRRPTDAAASIRGAYVRGAAGHLVA
jgi:hypothetical protein